MEMGVCLDVATVFHKDTLHISSSLLHKITRASLPGLSYLEICVSRGFENVVGV